MSFWVGAGFWWGVGIVLGVWANEAAKKWLDVLAERGVVPEGASSLSWRSFLHPRSLFSTLWAVTKVTYPHAYRSDDPVTETWRIRRARRRTLFVAWMFGGIVFALAVMIVVELAQKELGWGLLLVPIAAGFVFTARKAYRYGNTDLPG